MEAGEERIGKLETVHRASPAIMDDSQTPLSRPAKAWEELESGGTAARSFSWKASQPPTPRPLLRSASPSRANAGRKSKSSTTASRPIVTASSSSATFAGASCGQRPQQFFVALRQEALGAVHRRTVLRSARWVMQPELQFHRVMPNVTVACPHLEPPLMEKNPETAGTAPPVRPSKRSTTMNDGGERRVRQAAAVVLQPDGFASWSLGHFENRGIIYDSMDELSQFTGAPPQPDRQ